LKVLGINIVSYLTLNLIIYSISMIKKIFFIAFFCVTAGLFAQHDSIKKGSNRFADFSNINYINAKIIEKKVAIFEKEETHNDISYLFYTKKENYNLSYTFDPKKYLDPNKEDKHNFLMGTKPLDSDVLVIKHFDGKNVSQTKLKTAQNLGTIQSNTKFIRIEYKDFGLVDGDRVNIYLNEKEIDSNVKLNGLYYTIHIRLEEKGYNRIDIEAINQGSVGPNTAEFVVYDDKGNVLTHKAWNLKKGNVATLGIIKH